MNSMILTGNNQTIQQLIYLCGCAVNGVVPDAEIIGGMDFAELFHTAERHMLTATVAYALELAGIHDASFEQARVKAIRKTAIMDTEQAKVFERLEEAGIWYMPLKGAVLKDLYPSYGIRQMSDRDILVDADKMEEVRTIMEDLGFTTKHYGEHHHDCYFKPPLSNFEMHWKLFEPEQGKRITEYYSNVKTRFIKDDCNKYGWHFSPEDFYIHMVTHEFKHYSGNGTGLRSLLDIYVYLKNVQFDDGYVAAETQKLGISDFEKANRELALDVFSGKPLADAEQSMLKRFAVAGTYGSTELFAENQLAAKGRKGYFLSRLTLPYAVMKEHYPILEKCPVLYPFCWLHRLVYGFFFKNKKFMHQLKTGMTWDKE